MKRQFHKIKVAAENLSRSNKLDKNTDELHEVEKQVDKYKDVLQILNKKISAGQPQDVVAREKRSKKVHEFILGQIMEDSAKDFPTGLLKEVLDNCAKLEKTIATEIVNNEINVENDVSKKLNGIIEQHISTIQKQKRIVAKCHQEHDAAKQKLQAAQRSSEQTNLTKIHQLKEDEDGTANKLEKERDLYASHMFDLLAEEESIANYIMNYVKFQQLYYKSALKEIEHILENMNGLFRKNHKKVFNTSLDDHLDATGRKISFALELCVCCLVERGLYEEGLLRVGCATTKLKRMISAIDANFAGPPLPEEYKDVHVIAGVLKKYLRSLPEPLLTFEFYDDFVIAAQKQTEHQRKIAILDIINQLPEENYNNLKYLTKFLSYLSQKQEKNKMTSQNIAIVMSPNLLWSPNNTDQSYMEQVNSTATVNTIVEALIVDWDFFFDGDVNFYVTMTRDELFPDNGGFPYDKEQSIRTVPIDNMSKSMNAAITTSSSSTVGQNDDSIKNQFKPLPSHSRSSSHDTSLILINDQIKNRSQSNSSMSDHSSPPQESSPKLPVRRKHNKQAAPTPPDNNANNGTKMVLLNRDTNNKLHSMQYFKQLNASDNVGATADEDFQSLQHFVQPKQNHTNDKLLTRSESHDNLLKLKADKQPPPRPQAVSVECQTLNRMHLKLNNNHQKSSALICDNVNSSSNKDFSNKIAFPLPVKPVALPRTTLSSPKSMDGDEGSVSIREKPAIPERPAILMRPQSFKGSVPEMSRVSEGTNTIITAVTTPLKKTQSFRSESLPSAGASAAKNDNHFGSTVLERTQIYNIDKQQVAIIDVVDPTKQDKEEEKTSIENELTASTTSLNIDMSLQQVPPSPRGFDQKIKRPGVPAPPPPTTRPKSSDSTDL